MLYTTFQALGLWLALWAARPITSTEQLVAQMHRRYHGKAAATITFTQYNTIYKADTVAERSVWYEAIAYPANFRIDFGELAEGNAVIFARDSVYNFRKGALAAKRPFVNNLILLAGGLNHLEVSEALGRLKGAGYKLELFREEVWQGRPAYVVGAAPGDLASPQFWIDKKHLYLVRTIEKLPDGAVREARFSKHIRTAKGWTETEVLFLRNGQREQLEEYKNVKANVALPQGLFDSAYFGKVHWLK